MASTKVSWTEKLHGGKTAQVKRTAKAFADIPEDSLMFIATPLIIDAAVQALSVGQIISLKTLRAELAAQYRAEYTCPVTTGIFLRIVAEAAWEQYGQGASLKRITPFWRVIEPDSTLAKKLSCGVEFIRQQRERELTK
jgi:hypothetical protein